MEINVKVNIKFKNTLENLRMKTKESLRNIFLVSKLSTMLNNEGWFIYFRISIWIIGYIFLFSVRHLIFKYIRLLARILESLNDRKILKCICVTFQSTFGMLYIEVIYKLYLNYMFRSVFRMILLK